MTVMGPLQSLTSSPLFHQTYRFKLLYVYQPYGRSLQGPLERCSVQSQPPSHFLMTVGLNSASSQNLLGNRPLPYKKSRFTGVYHKIVSYEE